MNYPALSHLKTHSNMNALSAKEVLLPFSGNEKPLGFQTHCYFCTCFPWTNIQRKDEKNNRSDFLTTTNECTLLYKSIHSVFLLFCDNSIHSFCTQGYRHLSDILIPRTSHAEIMFLSARRKRETFQILCPAGSFGETPTGGAHCPRSFQTCHRTLESWSPPFCCILWSRAACKIKKKFFQTSSGLWFSITKEIAVSSVFWV